MRQKPIAILAAFFLLCTGCTPAEKSDQQYDLQIQRPQESTSSATEDVTEEADISTIRLPYMSGDSLNPFLMKTSVNQALTPLLYDSLTVVDKEFRPQNQLAESIRLEGPLCVIKLRRDALFSDGTLLTAQDVIYSLQTALATEGLREPLQNVADYAVNEEGNVEIRLREADADFAALLSFPIVKDKTAQADYPTGISKYYVSGTWQSGVVLSFNPIYYEDPGRVQTIRLLDVAGSDALQFHLRMGELDMIYSDLSSAELSSLSSSNRPVALNRMVYLGVNAQKGLLARPEFRHALSLALNRSELAVTAYVGRADPTMFPFHPSFYRSSEIDLAAPRKLAEAERLFDGLGISQRDTDGYRQYEEKPVTLSLLVNSENAYRTAAATLIADQLKQAGIKVEVVSKAYAQYGADISARNFDLYIGETRLAENMDISHLMPGGSLAYAVTFSEPLAERYQTYRETGESIAEFYNTFLVQSPFIPLVFRQGMYSVSREFSAEVTATEQNLFYNILEW